MVWQVLDWNVPAINFYKKYEAYLDDEWLNGKLVKKQITNFRFNEVYKFGGASVKDAAGVRNVVSILQSESDVNLMIVISAMGKTTNALETIVNEYYSGNSFSLDSIKQYHFDIMNQLFERNHPIYDEVNNLFVEIEWAIENAPTGTYAYEYDQIVSVGELLSTTIISAYLKDCGYTNRWLDARDIIRTDKLIEMPVLIGN